MSKLKRKKCAVAETRPEPKLAIKHHGDDVPQSLKRADRGPWWTASGLTELEELWSRALQALCPTVSDVTAVCCVPELPQPSTSALRAEHSEWPWRSLDEETRVPPLPLTPSPHSLTSHTSLTPSPHALPSLPPLAHSPRPDDSSRPPHSSLSRAALDEAGGCVLNHSTEHFTLNQGDHHPKASSAEHPHATEPQQQSAAPHLRHLEADERKRPSLWKLSERPDSAREWRLDENGARVAGGLLGNSAKSQGLEWGVEKPRVQTSSCYNNRDASSEFVHWRAGKEDGKESGKLFRSGISVHGLQWENPPKNGLSVIANECKTPADCADSVSTRERGSGLGAGSGSGGCGLETVTEVGRPGPGLAGAGLDCCPMCLMLFPKGFSQMECDAHLAQCLSEMNTDMVW